MWLSWLVIVPQSERLLVQFLVRAHAWVVDSILVRVHMMFLSCISVSLPSLSPSFPVSKNK